MFTRRQFVKAGVAGVAGGMLLPGFARPAIAASRGGTLRVALTADPLSFDPHLTGNLQGRGATQAIHDTLFGISETGELAPMLVESWEQPDNRTYLLHLRSGVRFHDGTPFNAEAVIYNIERIRNPDTKSIRAGEIKALDTIEAIDDLTIKMVLQYPFAAFLFPFTDVAGCIGSPTAFEKYGVGKSGLNPVGTGPFKLVSYSQDTETVMERNGDYWDDGKPYIDRLILRPIPTDSTRLTELETGGVDIAEGLPLQNIAPLREKADIIVSERVGFQWEYFGFNAKEGFPFSNHKLRQAFQWLIDREALHQAAYFGTGSIGFSGILPGHPFHDPTYRPYSFNMDMAKKLLDESGVGSAEITAYLRPEPIKQRAAQIVQAMAADVGIKINLEQVDYANHRAKLRSGDLPMDMHGWWGYRPDPDQYLNILLSSDGSYAEFHGYNNPAMDELFRSQRAETDQAKRRAYFRKIVEMMNEDAIYVPWHYSSDFKGLSPKVKGFRHAADSIIQYKYLSLED
ncbi:ABC transporter substrate-binding protein [Limibacillus halophilus]|uniref:Peptide/nickel transport system substrate-binding protein n=1 Tax=Limibacillus halophilus TaxID=1579333 RepID=A0A839SNY8_9PROT|nr:ABC transporter substrate-binding protein [Limibacillus halophilus]MBB3064521.1 peptide/nickel transport system substrate-binding protein [Limibacillus halophilus]